MPLGVSRIPPALRKPIVRRGRASGPGGSPQPAMSFARRRAPNSPGLVNQIDEGHLGMRRIQVIARRHLLGEAPEADIATASSASGKPRDRRSLSRCASWPGRSGFKRHLAPSVDPPLRHRQRSRSWMMRRKRAEAEQPQRERGGQSSANDDRGERKPPSMGRAPCLMSWLPARSRARWRSGPQAVRGE